MQNLMPPVDTPDNLFHDGDPTQGIEGTIVEAEWMNDSQGATRDTQQELINVLAAAEMQPDPSDPTQLVTAINLLVQQAVSGAVSGIVPGVGELYITKTENDPHVKYPGTIWVKLPPGVTLRTAAADNSDLGDTVGADTVTLNTGNLPAHAHNIGGSTGSGGSASATSGSYDPPSISSGGGGAHSHTVDAQTNIDPYDENENDGDGNVMSRLATLTTSDAADHTHTVDQPAHSHSMAIPAHSHTLPAATQNTGSGTAFNIIPKSLIVNIWERTA